MGCDVVKTPFGATPDGSAVDLYTLTNGAGMSVSIATYGCTVVSLRVPDRAGRVDDVVLGHPTLQGYLAEPTPYFGAMVGRYANRIARGDLVVDGEAYALPLNEGEHHLHGGPGGFHARVWSARALSSGGCPGVELSRVSPHGEEGYPGRLSATATFTVSESNELTIECMATTDRPTVCNLSHHGYFDLDAGASGDILGHVLTLRARRFTPVGRGLIPTGELRSVRGTPMDFTSPVRVGDRIGQSDEQLARGRGYDHNWVIDRDRPGLVPAARLLGPERGRIMEVLTTEPGVQFYSGNFLDGSIVGKGGRLYRPRAGLCLETQHFPDSPHEPAFPSTVLRPGHTYRTTTVYRFGVVA
jgi:aldose 1-epimerase